MQSAGPVVVMSRNVFYSVQIICLSRCRIGGISGYQGELRTRVKVCLITEADVIAGT